MPLDLGHRAALGREDFLVAPSNSEAVAWIDAWPNWPAAGLIVYGPEASGKTHLAKVWCHRSQALMLEASEIAGREAPSILGSSQAVVIERVDRGVDERALFHLFNVIQAQRGSLLLTGTGAPATWPIALPDLRSRLLALPSVAVGAPDDTLMEAVMVKLFADRQLRVSPDVVSYLHPRLERSLAMVQRVVAALDRTALAEGRAVTVPLARQVLHSLGISG